MHNIRGTAMGPQGGSSENKGERGGDVVGGRLDHVRLEPTLRSTQEGTVEEKELVNTFTLRMVPIEIYAF